LQKCINKCILDEVFIYQVRKGKLLKHAVILLINGGILMSMKFMWDENKAVANLSKHGISFDEAKTVFDDPLYIDFYDPDHSYNEQRYIFIGQSQQNHLLIVSYTEQENAIRLISAREATRKERKTYEEG